MKSISLLVLFALAAASGVARAEVKKGDKFVELDATTASGKKFHLKDMAGKWVLFTFGASWCEPCHKELPAWDKVAPRLGGKVLFVSVNINNNADEGKQFMQSLKLKHIFPVFLPDENSPAIKAYDPEKMPSTFVIDPEGTVRLVEYGYHPGDEDQLAKTLGELTKK
ncbi:MAG TPA: TlpA disulfide reductase family protein [Kofleriaceae bacterium]|jgi:thiol-disulfide isomerase/thioredoxin